MFSHLRFMLALALLLLFGCSETTLKTADQGDDGDPVIADGDVTDGDNIEYENEINVCGVGDFVKHPRQSRKIYYGADYPSLFDMSEGQVLSLGAIVFDYGGYYSNFCTGTLIGSRLVLTAAHCLDQVWDPDAIKFLVGPDVTTPVAVLDIDEVHSNPNYQPYGSTAEHDNGILVLAESAFESAPQIIPIPANDTPLTEDLVGNRVQNGGFGQTEVSSNNTRRLWVSEDIYMIGNGEFLVNGNGEGGVCFGDSGGPSIYDFGQGIRVIGAVSFGDESCVDVDHFSDVEHDYDWIGAFYSQQQDCGSLDENGACAGDMARWCEEGVLKEENCRQNGRICGDTGNGRFRCIQDPCLGITFQGICDENDVARWCEEGEIRFKYCIPCDQVCGWAGPAFGKYCIDEPIDGDMDSDSDSDHPDEPCGSVTWLGCCEGNTAVWCDDESDALMSEDCSAYGLSCGWSGDYGYYCGGDGEDPSGRLPLECP